MAKPVLMPQAGQSMTEGKIVKWLVGEGAVVRKGEPILEIETDKANLEVEAAADGVLRKVLRKEGDVVPVLTPVGVIAGPDEPLDLEALMAAEPAAVPLALAVAPAALAAAPAPLAAAPAAGSAHAAPAPSAGAAVRAASTVTPVGAPPAASAPATAAPANGPMAPAGRAGRVPASPLARRLARRHDIELRRVRGSGPRGRIIRRDVEAAMKARDDAGGASGSGPALRPAGDYPPPAARPPARVPLAGMRKAIATALQRSKTAAPHFYVTVEIDLTAALALRKSRQNGQGGAVFSVNDLILRAVAIGLRDEPRVNCRVGEEAIDYPTDVNIGIAVGLEEGLVVPVVLRAQERTLADIAAESVRLIELARQGKLVGTGQGTFTVSNLGMYGVKSFTAVINPPEGAILAVGAAMDRLVAVPGGLLSRKILEATLSADHRAIDGVLAARFMARLKRLLEEPDRLF